MSKRSRNEDRDQSLPSSISLLLGDQPDLTEAFFQELDQGRFAQVLKPLVATVDPFTFSAKKEEEEDETLICLCKAILNQIRNNYSSSIVEVPPTSMELIPTTSDTPFQIVSGGNKFKKILLAKHDWIESYKGITKEVIFVTEGTDDISRLVKNYDKKPVYFNCTVAIGNDRFIMSTDYHLID